MSDQPALIQLDNITIAGKWWGNPEGEKTIALHGWFDNVNSYDWLAPLLTDMHIFCDGFSRTRINRSSTVKRAAKRNWRRSRRFS